MRKDEERRDISNGSREVGTRGEEREGDKVSQE